MLAAEEREVSSRGRSWARWWWSRAKETPGDTHPAFRRCVCRLGVSGHRFLAIGAYDIQPGFAPCSGLASWADKLGPRRWLRSRRAFW